MQAPATIAFTTTQMAVGLILSVIALVGSGVAFGRLTERQKEDHKVLHDALDMLKAAMADLKSDNQRGREEMVDWRFWRVVTDERLGGHDEELATLTNGHEEVRTKIVVLEDRRKGERREHGT